MGTGGRVVLILAVVGVIYLAVGLLAHFRWEGSRCELPVVVEVLNGCGRVGIADKVACHLRDLGFDVMHVGNADDFCYPQTMVVDRTGDLAKARAVTDALGRIPVVHQVTSTFFVDVTVVVGEDIIALCDF
jgi:hypothetical protein